ncbi:MAG: hypothetical protein EOM25_13990, partial [Deltaproteobacteria bacterium]|nr:hypothetical protein [Deltaproteobacteria bacterium]
MTDFFRRNVFRAEFLLLALLLGMTVTLGLDVWLTMATGHGLCTTSSCEVVGEYVRIGELLMVQAGAGFFLFLWLLALVAKRTGPTLWHLFTIALIGALAFDGAILGFQFVALGEKCQLCMIVGLGLFLILFQYAFVRRSVLVLLLGLAVWTSGFVANSVLKLNPTTPALENTAFLQWPSESDPWKEYPSFHLFFSLHCGHCARVMANLAANDMAGFPWTFHMTDTKSKDLSRAAHILASEDTAENPFRSIVSVERAADLPAMVFDPKTVAATEWARDYLRAAGHRGVPLLLVDLDRNRRIVLSGMNSILSYLEEEGLLLEHVDDGDDSLFD